MSKSTTRSGTTLWIGVALIALILFPLARAKAQGGGQQSKTKELLEKIIKDMKTIDKLLDQASTKSASSKKSASASSSAAAGASQGRQSSAADPVEKMLEESMGTSKRVVEQINKLLEMAQQSGGGSGSGGKKPQGGQKSKGMDSQPKPDDRLQRTPDMIRQGQEGKQGKNRKSPKAAEQKGSRQKGKQGAQGESERLNKAAEQGKWGSLPPYLQFLFKKGGKPKLPSKYERYREEFHKRADSKRKR